MKLAACNGLPLQPTNIRVPVALKSSLFYNIKFNDNTIILTQQQLTYNTVLLLHYCETENDYD